MSERRANDVYETEAPLALAMCQLVKEEFCPAPGLIFEPSCGSGAFIRAARATWGHHPEVVGVDIRSDVRADALAAGANLFMHMDWLAPLPSPLLAPPKPDLIAGNTPFDRVELHVARAVERVAPGGIAAFLLSCNLFWPSEPKEPFWDVPGLVMVQPWFPRPDFLRCGKTDAVGVATFIWSEGYDGPIELRRPKRWRGLLKKTQSLLPGMAVPSKGEAT